MASSILIALLLATVVASVPAVTHAQEGWRNSLSGESLDVLVEPTWSDDGQARFKVSFLQPGTDTVQVHIDYDFVIMQGDQEVFSAVPPGQALLHTAEGVVTIPNSPYEFPSNGEYEIVVSVAGINFIPINTETATFPVTVVPEFPVGIIGVVAALMGSVIVMSRRFKLRL